MDRGKKRTKRFDYVYLDSVRIFRETMGLKDELRDTIPTQAIRRFSDHFNVIGNIAVLSVPPELSLYAPTIARTIISRHHNIRTVLNKTSPVNGCNRTACFEIILGTDTITTHHEYGFTYRLDVVTVFFDPRLAHERKRINDQVRAGERVLVPFCGVGPYVIPAAAHGAGITAIEQNQEACRWLSENVLLNGVSDQVTTITGDAFDVSPLHDLTYDRAIIPTPYGMDAIFDRIISKVKPRGMIHFYTFKNQAQAKDLVTEFEQKGYEVVFYRRCGNVAPSVSRWVYDVRITGTVPRQMFPKKIPRQEDLPFVNLNIS
jgi:tRNA (guanine37-N1)-methyltransferase